MNRARIEAFASLFILNLIGFGPISLTALIGIYLLWARPPCFLTWVRKIYERPHQRSRLPVNTRACKRQIEGSLILLGLFIIDVLPVPVTGGVAIVITWFRPKSFLNWLEAVYGQADTSADTDRSRKRLR